MFADAVRSLRRSRGTFFFSLLILTLAIAAATVTFSVVDAVVLRPLPFPEPSRLVAIEHQRGDQVMSQVRSVSAFQYLAMREAAEPETRLAAVAPGAESLEYEDGSSERIWSARVTASIFEVLGVRPVLGDAFTAAEEVSGNDRVAVIGYELWTRRFARDPGVVGRSIRTSHGTLRVVGVMPDGFTYPLVADRTSEMWTPYAIPADERTGRQPSAYLHIIGRLRAGAAAAELQTRIDAVRRRLAMADPERYSVAGRFLMLPLRDWTVGPVKEWMLLVLVAIGLLLLIACANVANLLLSGTLLRTRELSIRSTLGATRRGLIGSLLLESALLSSCAVGLAVLFSWWGVEAARNALPPGIARAHLISLNLRVFTAAVIVTVVTAVLIGIIPAFHAGRQDLITVLKNTATNPTGARPVWRRAVLSAEIAFTAVLLVATTLFVSSFVRLIRADLGFNRSHLLVITDSTIQGSVADVAERFKLVPGVVSVGGAAAGSPPLVAAGFQGGSSGTRLRLPSVAAGAGVAVEFNRVTPDYFAAAGIPLRVGRPFEYRDLAQSMRSADLAKTNTAIVDELAARQLFGDADPIGREIMYGPFPAVVVGVVAHVKMRGPEADSSPQAYFPGPVNASSYSYLVRTAGSAVEMIPQVQAAIGSMLAPAARPAVARPIEDAFRNITARRRFTAATMTLFAIVALLIGATGVYAVMTSLVAQRTREIGIRMALGATPRKILTGVLLEISRQLAFGLAVGLPASWLVARGFEGLFFEMHAADLWVYAFVSSGLLLIALFAAFGPARRASLVEPLLSLRAD